MMLYEGGFRISELGNLTWGDVKFDNNGVVVNTNAKTMKPRYIRLTMSRQYLATWKADYPFSPDPEAVVFITNRKEAITYDGVRRQILYITERAGITRKITPHLFRHSRITHLIQQGVSESVIKLMMWGSVKTDMFETYAHLTGTDIDRAMFELNGIKEPGKAKPEKLEARQCPNCYEISGPLTNFCPKCGNQLTEEAKEITTSAQDAVINHPELKALLKALGMSDSAIDLLLKQVRKE